jgi:hypothetical protein
MKGAARAGFPAKRRSGGWTSRPSFKRQFAQGPGSVWPSSQRIGPTLPPVHHPQGFDGLRTQAIRHDVWRSADDQLARSHPPTRPPDLRELEQAGDRRHDTFNLPVGGQDIVAGDIRPRRGQIVHRRLGPDYPHSGMGSSSGRPHDRTHATTSSWATTRPVSAARRPVSIAASCHSWTATKSCTACSMTHDLGRSRPRRSP